MTVSKICKAIAILMMIMSVEEKLYFMLYHTAIVEYINLYKISIKYQFVQ